MTSTKKKAEPAPPAALDIADVRVRLGEIWGLHRPLTKQELGRALCLSPKYGGEHVAKWESGKSPVSGTAEVALRMMLKGAKPHTMDDVIVPGYPRGEVRVQVDSGRLIRCKLGTIPMLVWERDRRTPLEVGRVIRVKRQRGAKWETVRVTRVDPDGYFMADLF